MRLRELQGDAPDRNRDCKNNGSIGDCLIAIMRRDGKYANLAVMFVGAIAIFRRVSRQHDLRQQERRDRCE